VTHPPFTLDGYAETLRGLLARGYAVSDFHTADPSQPHLVLRHDVDQSIPRARAMAEREAAEGWRASYFILLRTEMYNPWSAAATADLRAMAALGHEIGLHLDATCYGDEVSLEAGAEAECRSLEDVTGQPVRLISFHRPARERIGGDNRIAGRLHTYMDRFTRDMGYSSDSRGGWRHGHPWDHVAVAKKRALQLLTHAVWWVGPEGQSPRERLAAVLDEHGKRLDAELAANSDVWRGDHA
jgi:hypothetical protein